MRKPSLVSLALVLLAALPATASAAEPFTVTNFQITATVGPKDDTKCVVDADIYKPNDVSATNPAPAILATNGFGGSKDDFKALAASYAKRGYVFLAYSGLGFGGPGQDNQSRRGSDCKITLDDPDWDGKAARTMIDFLGGKVASDDGKTKVDYVIRDDTDHAGGHSANDPRVGMIGGSYGGQIQFAAADVDPRLDTIVPQITWNDLAYSLAPNNTAFTKGVTYDPVAPGVEKYEWTSLFFGLGIADGGAGSLSGQNPTHLGPCPNFADQACQSKAQMDATGYPDKTTIDFARHASVESYMTKIRIPTFLAQGEVDTLFNLNEAVATYEALRAQGTPVKMLWRSAGHSGGNIGKSEDDPANPEGAYASRAYLEWFDYYLRGLGSAPKLDFSYFRDWVPVTKDVDAAPSVASAAAYPVAPDVTYFLSGDGALVEDPSKVKAGALSYQWAAGSATSYSETSAVDQSQAPRDGQGTFVSWTSAALPQDTDVVGIPKVTLQIAAPIQQQAGASDPGGRLVLFAKLYDVGPDGALTLPNRLIAPVRVPDLSKPITITLPGIVHRFAKGHKLQLVIAASDAAYKNNDLAGQATITIDPKKPFTLTVPILGATLSPTVTAPRPVAAPPGSQVPGAGAQKPVIRQAKAKWAAKFARRCSRARSLAVRLRSALKGDRILSATITVNGKRVRTVRGRALRKLVRLRNLPRGRTFRVAVTERTGKNGTLRSARTYRKGC